MDVDEMWPLGPVFICDNASFRPGTDSVLLASFAAAVKAKTACDLGCGTGLITILLALVNTALSVVSVEIQPGSAALAGENVRLNNLGDRITVLVGDLRRHRDFLKAGAYDLVVANPPYYAQGTGKTAPDESRATAREERDCTLEDIVTAAAYLTRWGGRFALVHKPERLAEVICTLSQRGLEPKRLRFVQYKTDSAPNLVLLEARRGGKPGLSIEPPLILTDADGNDSDEVRKIYHRG
jgi:tRNA1(Val) A37 N6-methylase TrmN6